LKTIVPIALSRPDSGDAVAVEVTSALAGAASATAAVSAEAAVLSVAAVLALPDVDTTAATTGSTVDSVDSAVSVDSVESLDGGSSTCRSATRFAAGLRSIAAGFAASATVSAVSDPVGVASSSVAAAGFSSGCWAGSSVSSAVLSSSPCWAASVSSAALSSAVASVFGFLPEGFGFGVPVPSLSESGLLSVGFADSEDVVPLASEPDGLSALATPAPVAIPAATPAVTVTAPNHSKNRSAMPPPVPDRGNGNARCQLGKPFTAIDTRRFISHRPAADRFMLRPGATAQPWRR